MITRSSNKDNSETSSGLKIKLNDSMTNKEESNSTTSGLMDNEPRPINIDTYLRKIKPKL